MRGTRSRVQPLMAVNWQCLLVVTPTAGATELHINLHPMARALFLVALRARGAALVALIRRQPAEAQPVADPPHPRRGDLDVVVVLDVHRDARGAEAVVLAQTHDPLHRLALGSGGAVIGPRVAVSQSHSSQIVEPVLPLVEHRPADPVVAAPRHGVP